MIGKDIQIYNYNKHRTSIISHSYNYETDSFHNTGSIIKRKTIYYNSQTNDFKSQASII